MFLHNPLESLCPPCPPHNRVPGCSFCRKRLRIRRHVYSAGGNAYTCTVTSTMQLTSVEAKQQLKCKRQVSQGNEDIMVISNIPGNMGLLYGSLFQFQGLLFDFQSLLVHYPIIFATERQKKNVAFANERVLSKQKHKAISLTVRVVLSGVLSTTT